MADPAARGLHLENGAGGRGLACRSRVHQSVLQRGLAVELLRVTMDKSRIGKTRRNARSIARARAGTGPAFAFCSCIGPRYCLTLTRNLTLTLGSLIKIKSRIKSKKSSAKSEELPAAATPLVSTGERE